MIKLSAVALAAAVALAETAGPAPATLMTQESVNVFRRFSVDRAKVLEFYGDVVGLQVVDGAEHARRRSDVAVSHRDVAVQVHDRRSGPPGEVRACARRHRAARLHVLLCGRSGSRAKAFTSHGYPAPEFRGAAGHRRAMVTDPDGQWVELVVDPPGGDPSHFEVGATVSDLEKSRAFYREFVGLEELPAVDSAFGRTLRFTLGPKSSNILNLWAARPGAAANTYTAGIQYVISDAEAVDVRARAAGVKITQPLGPFGGGLRTIWLADPDGITNYFAQILRNNQR